MTDSKQSQRGRIPGGPSALQPNVDLEKFHNQLLQETETKKQRQRVLRDIRMGPPILSKIPLRCEHLVLPRSDQTRQCLNAVEGTTKFCKTHTQVRLEPIPTTSDSSLSDAIAKTYVEAKARGIEMPPLPPKKKPTPPPDMMVKYQWRWEYGDAKKLTKLHVTCNGTTLTTTVPKTMDVKGMTALLVALTFPTGSVQLKIGVAPVGSSQVSFNEGYSPPPSQIPARF